MITHNRLVNGPDSAVICMLDDILGCNVNFGSIKRYKSIECERTTPYEFSIISIKSIVLAIGGIVDIVPATVQRNSVVYLLTLWPSSDHREIDSFSGLFFIVSCLIRSRAYLQRLCARSSMERLMSSKRCLGYVD